MNCPLDVGAYEPPPVPAIAWKGNGNQRGSHSGCASRRVTLIPQSLPFCSLREPLPLRDVVKKSFSFMSKLD